MIGIVDERIAQFKEQLSKLTSQQIVQKEIIFGDCAVLESGLYHTLREKVALNFKIHPNEVLVVGSAKLGFSIAPHKKYRYFGNNSDIDVVIVSPNLFDLFWKNVYNLWREKIIWESENDFKKYLFQGWIRPDKLPNSKNFQLSNDWWEFFRNLTSTGDFGPYKINGAIYKDWNFLEGYQNFAVQYCKDQL